MSMLVFGVLNTENFARALRLRMPWYEWYEQTKLWVGMGNHSDEKDLELLYASTTITVGMVPRPPLGMHLGHMTGNQGERTPHHEVPTRKNLKVKEALHADAWVSKIKISINFSMTHLRQFIALWTLIRGFHVDEHAEDDILWKHTGSGHYSTTSAY